MHVGLDGHGPQGAARMPEADAVVAHIELAADLAEDIQVGHHVGLVGALDHDVAVGGQGG